MLLKRSDPQPGTPNSRRRVRTSPTGKNPYDPGKSVRTGTDGLVRTARYLANNRMAAHSAWPTW